jgi:transmembrane sensor
MHDGLVRSAGGPARPAAGGTRWRGTMRPGGRGDAFHRSVWRRRLLLVGCTAAAAWIGVVYERSKPQVATTATARRTYATLSGERAELRLADGTRVRLAPGSKLSISADYGTERRNVYLDGQAYFDVLHDAQKPFSVFVGNAIARDLGTTFAVRSYPEDGAVQVVVRSGQVALTGVGKLGAGDLGRLAANGRSSIRHGVNVTRMLGWLDGSLSFVDAPLGRVLQDMHRWYDVDVTLGDSSLASLPFTGTLADVSPNAAVDLVAATVGLTVRRSGTRTTLFATR